MCPMMQYKITYCSYNMVLQAKEIPTTGYRQYLRWTAPSLRGRGLGCNYVIYFFAPLREVYLRSVINLYLRGVINLYFVHNKLCNFLAFTLRLSTYIFCELPPPFARARLQTPFCSFIFTGVVRVSCFAKRHPPLRSTGGDDDCENVL